MLSTYVLPHLPPTNYRLAYQVPTVTRSLTPSLALSAGIGSTTGSSNSSFISGVTLPSAITPPTNQGKGVGGQGAGQTRDRVHGSYLANVNPDRALMQLIEPGIKIHDLMGTDPLLLLDDNTQICLSYLLPMGYWSNCKRANSHGCTLTAAECTRLDQYLKTQMNKLHSRATAPGVLP